MELCANFIIRFAQTLRIERKTDLKVAHGVEGCKEAHEGDADDDHVLPYEELLPADLLRRHGRDRPHPVIANKLGS